MRLAKRKWPDRSYYDIETGRLGVDEHGVWLASRRGSVVRRDGSPVFELDRDALHLIPAGVWWTVWFTDRQTYVDICTPAVFGDEEIAFVDLDLDVIRDADGVRLDDLDELERHAVELAYPPHLVIGAHAAAAAVTCMVEEGRGPFAPGVTDRWWSHLDAQGPDATTEDAAAPAGGLDGPE